MKSHIPDLIKTGHIIRLELTADEAKNITWEDQNEFRYKEDMYDVIEKHTAGTMLIINCLPDKKETKIVNEYLKINKTNNSTDSFPSIALLKLITTQYLPSILFNDFDKEDKCLGRKWQNLKYNLPSIVESILTPPPREI